MKDVLERRFCNLVCAGKLDLQTVQHEIATDWIKTYQKYIAKTPPTAEVHGQPRFVRETITESEVSVNTRSGKNFKPGSRFYGKTKEGKFMTEIDALDSGVFTSAWDRSVAYAKKPEADKGDRWPNRGAGNG